MNSMDTGSSDRNRVLPSSKASSGMSEQEVFKTCLFHCILIVMSPIFTFFVIKLYIFDALLQLESMQSNLYSALAAVVVLHLALANFIYRAYFQTETVPGFDKLEKED